MKITAKTKICMIIGDPIAHSLSPQMHNAAYKALGIDGEFVHVAAHVPVDQIEDAVHAVRALEIRGLTCTIPHKVAVMKYLDYIDPIAKKIGAANTIVNENGILKGYNTDWIGVIKSLEKVILFKGKTTAIIGAGGAARAMAFALSQKGSRIFIYNRSRKKAQELAKEFGGTGRSLDSLDELHSVDIILNATPVGMHPHTGTSPIPKRYITSNHVVFDAIYTPFETQLLKDAKAKGAKTIHGYEMLLYEGMEKFKLFTGHNAPESVMKKVLLKNLLKV